MRCCLAPHLFNRNCKTKLHQRACKEKKTPLYKKKYLTYEAGFIIANRQNYLAGSWHQQLSAQNVIQSQRRDFLKIN
jgi:hypothetical protein